MKNFFTTLMLTTAFFSSILEIRAAENERNSDNTSSNRSQTVRQNERDSDQEDYITSYTFDQDIASKLQWEEQKKHYITEFYQKKIASDHEIALRLQREEEENRSAQLTQGELEKDDPALALCLQISKDPALSAITDINQGRQQEIFEIIKSQNQSPALPRDPSLSRKDLRTSTREDYVSPFKTRASEKRYRSSEFSKQFDVSPDRSSRQKKVTSEELLPDYSSSEEEIIVRKSSKKPQQKNKSIYSLNSSRRNLHPLDNDRASSGHDYSPFPRSFREVVSPRRKNEDTSSVRYLELDCFSLRKAPSDWVPLTLDGITDRLEDDLKAIRKALPGHSDQERVKMLIEMYTLSLNNIAHPEED